MSYLLDALRKAERERNLGRVPDLGHESHDSQSRANRRVPAWVVIMLLCLVLLNLALLAAFWWTGQDNGNSVPPTAAPPRAGVAAPTLEPAAPPEIPAEPPAPAVSFIPDPPEAAPAAAVTPSATEPEPEPELVSEAPQYNALEPGQRNQIPNLSMNGHLYSSIPGRSFVLVNGRRYHEGQRLPEGPAIVLIDEQGAVLKYRDISYRLDAPR